ncbi:MAG: type II toxin-antitoxin system VapC family toxin [Chloroflexi bacterium]|nr:type II toxin-antitoxin system VapC family toxin [Chloroflexota bacterium]MYD64598.1 type II toxin-antitoxin system VapC family toxin [Chloroflexota bacterium]
MTTAYVDTSALVAIATSEPSGPAVAERIATFDRVISGTILEAELRSVFVRQGRAWVPGVISRIHWVLPRRPLGPELAAALDAGYLRPGDLLHLATALYATEEIDRITFVTLDRRQAEVAAALGFHT